MLTKMFSTPDETLAGDTSEGACRLPQINWIS